MSSVRSLSGLPKGVFRARVSQKRGRVEDAARFPFGLGQVGVHEICEGAHGDMAALTGFALMAARWRDGPVLWVSQFGLARDHGRVLQAGLDQLGVLADRPLIMVAAHKRVETLWTVEEAIRSGAVGTVIAELDGADFTASRRLALASSRYGCPVLLLMPYTREGATAATARWRVRPRPSAPNRFDAGAPGSPRLQAVLERSRQSPHLAGSVFNLEWTDETLSLSVAAGLAAHTAPSRETG